MRSRRNCRRDVPKKLNLPCLPGDRLGSAVTRQRPGQRLRHRFASEDGEPVLMSRETLAQKRQAQGQATFATQMLLDPKGDSTQGFKREWLHFTKGEPNRHGLNVYIIVDPANTKRKSSDFTAIWALGLGRDRNIIALDLVRDRMNLRERTKTFFELVDRWKPLAVGYEEYGLQADIQHIEHVQEEENYRFKIIPLKGSMAKRDRIARLLPVFEQGRIYLPQTRFRTTHDGKTINLIDAFIEEEYVAFPVAVHDDMLDCLARIEDPDFPIKWPLSNEDARHGGKPSHLPSMSVNPNRSARTKRQRKDNYADPSESEHGL